MKPNSVRILVDDKIIDGVLEKNIHFLGSKKVTYQNQDGTTCILSINLVNIIYDELSGSTRN